MNSKKKYEAFPLPILNPIFSSLSSSFYSEDGGINILQNTGVRLHDSTVHKIIIFIVTASNENLPSQKLVQNSNDHGLCGPNRSNSSR
jgi:hypothetical protein